MIKLYNEDCLEGLAALGSGSVDMIATDPPYCVGATSNGIKGGYGDYTLLKPFFAQLAEEWSRVLKPGGYFYMLTDWRTYPFVYPLLLKRLEVRNVIIWDKEWINAGSWYRYRHEFIIFGTWSLKKLPPNSPNHPSEKPVSLMKRMIEDGTALGEVVLDPFMGSGSTGVAAVEMGRRFIGYEIDEGWYEVAERRIRDAGASVEECDIQGADLRSGERF